MNIEVPQIWSSLGIDDEVSLAQQLYDVYSGEATDAAEILVINSNNVLDFVTKQSSCCGARKEKTISEFIEKGALRSLEASGELRPKFDKKLGTDIYTLLIDWEGLRKYAGYLHDQEVTKAEGRSVQKDYFKKILQKIDDKNIEKEIYLTEKILGSYLDHVGTADVIRGENSPDCRFGIIVTLRNLEKDGFLTICDIKYDFRALPKPTEEEEERLERGVYIDEDAYFYPAEHCRVTVELSNSQSKEARLLRIAEKDTVPAEKILKAYDDDFSVKGYEEFYKDEIRLIKKLLEICEPDESTEVDIVIPATVAQNDPHRAGLDNSRIVGILKSKGVFSKFIDNSNGKSSVYCTVEVNYEKLLDLAGELHDEIEAKGIVYGAEQQKKFLLTTIKKIVNGNNDLKELKISEKILEPYYSEDPQASEGGLSLLRPDENRSDIRYCFMETINALAKDGNFSIKSASFNFDAKPIPTPGAKKRAMWAIGSSQEPTEFYPPDHCKVVISNFKFLSSQTRNEEKTGKEVDSQSTHTTIDVSINPKDTNTEDKNEKATLDSSPLYEITYSEHTRNIKLKGIILAKPDFDSENDNTFKHVFENPNKKITKEEIEKAIGGTLQKRLSDIVRDLGFTGDLRTVFFPVVTKNELRFVNPITKEYADKNELPKIDTSQIRRRVEAKRDKK